MSCTGLVFDIDRFASHDGPGIRTTIFLKGCPLSCLWCHSPESQSPKPELLFRADRCTACWLCLETCPRKALSKGERAVSLDRNLCDGCGRCCDVCYPGALEMAGRERSADEIVERIGRDASFFHRSGGGAGLRQSRFSPLWRGSRLILWRKSPVFLVVGIAFAWSSVRDSDL